MSGNFFIERLDFLAGYHRDKALLHYRGRDYSFNDIELICDKLLESLPDELSQSPIALELDRSPLYYAAIICCIKLRRPFIPIGSTYSAELKEHILQETKASILIKSSSEENEYSLKILNYKTYEVMDEGFDEVFAIFYTSGSTALPKGVKLSHAAVENRFSWMWNLFPYRSHEKQLFKAGIVFIDSLWECLGAFLQGYPTFIAHDELVYEPQKLLEACFHYSITRITVVPSYLKALLRSTLNDDEFVTNTVSIKYWIVSGEQFDKDLAEKIFTLAPKAKILNLYGSTEIMGDVTYHILSTKSFEKQNIPIGKSIVNNSVIIVNDRYEIITHDETEGSILVSGNQVTTGYINSDKNDKTFVMKNIDGHNKRWYVTGDVGILYKNSLICIGRKDRQAKVHGARINLNIIESIINSHPMVNDAAAIGDNFGGVCIFVVPRETKSTPLSLLQSTLKQYLDDRNIGPKLLPQFLIIDVLPKTSSGKINHLSLKNNLEILRAQNNTDSSNSNMLKLIEVVQKTLAIPHIEPSENLFNIGLHSLNAIHLAATIRKRFEKNIKIKQIFDKPSINDIYETLFCSG